jgi:dTMP kinase
MTGEGRRGVFITLEGIEGCGKTTQIKLLADALRSRGIPLLTTREPGGSPVGETIRRLLLSEDSTLCERAELLLYAAERAEHVARVIRPALERGEWVLCDRYGDATRAYQAFGRRLPRDEVEQAHAIASGGLEPDLTLYLRLPVETALERARARNGSDASGEGRFEAESMTFHGRVAAGYESLAAEFAGRVRVVDATGDVTAVARRILDALETHLER